jgi:hypothetical protein
MFIVNLYKFLGGFMKKLYLFNIYEWSDSDYFATLNHSETLDANPKHFMTLDFVDENQFIFFFRSTYNILFKTVKLFNTLEELTSYLLPLLYTGSLTEQDYSIGTIQQLLQRKSRGF